MSEVNRVDAIRAMWPTDRKPTAEDLAEAAGAVREILRTAAGSTVTAAARRTALPYASDGYDVIGWLAEATSSEAQFVDQLAVWADALRDDPTLRHNNYHPSAVQGSRDSAAAAAYELSEELRTAASHFEAAGRALRAAHVNSSPLFHA